MANNRQNRAQGIGPIPPAIESQLNPTTGTTSDILHSRYSPEEIAERQAQFEERGPMVEVISDEWYGQISEGDPFQETAAPFIAGNKDKEFRFISPAAMQKRGRRGYQQVYNRKGEPVEVAGQQLGWIPKEEKIKRDRRKEAAATSALEASKDRMREDSERAQVESKGRGCRD